MSKGTEGEFEERMAAIQGRMNAASSPPWTNEGTYVGSDEHGLICADFENDADPEFIAHARQDAPWLWAEVRRLQMKLRCPYRSSTILELRAEVCRLWKALDFACTCVPHCTPEQAMKWGNDEGGGVDKKPTIKLRWER